MTPSEKLGEAIDRMTKAARLADPNLRHLTVTAELDVVSYINVVGKNKADTKHHHLSPRVFVIKKDRGDESGQIRIGWNNGRLIAPISL